MIALAAAQLLALAGGMCYEDAECSLPSCQVAIRVCAGGRLRPCTCVVPEPPPPPVQPKPRWSVRNDALTKIRSPDPLFASPIQTAVLSMARNEFEAFQLVIEPPTGTDELLEFTLELNDLTSSGQSLVGNGGRIRIFREHQSSDVTMSRPSRPIEVRGVERRMVSHPA